MSSAPKYLTPDFSKSTLPLTKCWCCLCPILQFFNFIWCLVPKEIINTILVFSFHIVKIMASTASIHWSLYNTLYFFRFAFLTFPKNYSYAPNLSNSLIGKFCLGFHGITISGSRKRLCYCLLGSATVAGLFQSTM